MKRSCNSYVNEKVFLPFSHLFSSSLFSRVFFKLWTPSYIYIYIYIYILYVFSFLLRTGLSLRISQFGSYSLSIAATSLRTYTLCLLLFTILSPSNIRTHLLRLKPLTMSPVKSQGSSRRKGKAIASDSPAVPDVGEEMEHSE